MASASAVVADGARWGGASTAHRRRAAARPATRERRPFGRRHVARPRERAGSHGPAGFPCLCTGAVRAFAGQREAPARPDRFAPDAAVPAAVPAARSGTAARRCRDASESQSRRSGPGDAGPCPGVLQAKSHHGARKSQVRLKGLGRSRPDCVAQTHCAVQLRLGFRHGNRTSSLSSLQAVAHARDRDSIW